MPYIFLDETGQFTKYKDEKYFIVGSFTVGDPRRTHKRFRSWCKSRFPRKLRNLQEIKFSNNAIDNKLRLKTLRFIAKLDVRIRYVYLLKENIPEEYYKKGKLKSGHLYTSIIGELLEEYLPTADISFNASCDQRHLKGIKRSEFKEILKVRMHPQLSKKSIIEIKMIDSKKDGNIQIVDWISGALARYLEKRELGEECHKILQNNILENGARELFKDHWINKNLNHK